jgi:ChrR Cupin-like domain
MQGCIPHLHICAFTLDRVNTQGAPFQSVVASQNEHKYAKTGSETIDMQGLISYVDSSSVEWFQFRPGSRWKTLFEDPKTGQRAILVQWDAGYRMGEVDHHDRDEIVYVLSGTFVQNGRSSSPGTYIHHRAGSHHQASTPDGCTFLEIVTGQRARHGRPTAKQLAWFRNLPGCTPTAPPNKSVAAHDSLPRSARTGVSR